MSLLLYLGKTSLFSTILQVLAQPCVDGHAAMLGTVVTVLVAWTEFRYEVGSPSLGTKSVATRVA